MNTTAAVSKSKKMTTTIEAFVLKVVGAGLLILGSFAPAFASEQPEPTVTARGASLQTVIEEVAARSELRLVLLADLGRSVDIEIPAKPLPEALAEILGEESFQLYRAAQRQTGNAPGTLWVFSEGAAGVVGAAVFLEAVLYAGSAAEKKEAIRELRRVGTPSAVQSLSLALSDGNSRVRDAAFSALRRIDSDEARAAIASAALDSDPWIRAQAVAALTSGNSQSSAAYLSLAMDDPDPRVRMAVVEALADVPFGTVPSPQAVGALYNALRDDNPDVRMQALESLEDIGGDVAFEALMLAKRDQDADVARAAEESISSMGRSRN